MCPAIADASGRYGPARNRLAGVPADWLSLLRTAGDRALPRLFRGHVDCLSHLAPPIRGRGSLIAVADAAGGPARFDARSHTQSYGCSLGCSRGAGGGSAC
jgi:hypothetical protein